MAGIAVRSDVPWAYLATMAEVSLQVLDSPDMWTEVFEKKDSSISPDKTGVATGFMVGPGPLQNWGEVVPVPFDSIDPGRTKRTAYADYGTALAISRNAIEDELFGVYAEASRSLPYSATLFRNLRHAVFLNNLFNTTYFTDDSQPTPRAIGATNHASVNGADRPNILAVSESFGYDSVQKLLALAWQHNDEKGYPDPMLNDDEVINVVVHPLDGMLARRIFSDLSTYQPTDNTNSPNVLKAGNNFRVVVDPYITPVGAARPWYLVRTKMKPAWLVERRPPEISNYRDPRNKAMVVDLTVREAIHIPTNGQFQIWASGN